MSDCCLEELKELIRKRKKNVSGVLEGDDFDIEFDEEDRGD